MNEKNILIPNQLIIPRNLTYREVCERLSEDIWKSLQMITVEQAFADWLTEIQNPNTYKNYSSAKKMLIEVGLLDPFQTLQEFTCMNHNNIVDQIKLVKHWSECTRQARAACFIAFTNFLHRKSNGMIKKALAKKEGKLKTFSKVYHRVKTQAMTQPQWCSFLEQLAQINTRHTLIAKVILQGAKRVSEVLMLQTDQINWEDNQITFKQSKTGIEIRKTIITYPQSIMDSIKEYLGGRIGYVFVSSRGKPLKNQQLSKDFAKAGKSAKIPFGVTPHVLRASCITYLSQQGFHDSDIIKVSGHASMEQVRAYDKTSEAENASKKVFLVH